MSNKAPARESNRSPSDEALARVGQHMRFVQVRPRKQVIEGICIGVRRTGTTVRTSDGDWPGVQFQVETPGGKRTWTLTFADRIQDPLGHPLWGTCDCADEEEHHRRVSEEAPEVLSELAE